MPCGGIYPISSHWSGQYAPMVDSNCWQCKDKDPVTHFCEEWDCYLHERCIDPFLLTEEGQLVLSHGHEVVRKHPMRIGIVGGGVVGRATARSLIEHVDEVRVYDVLKERRTHPLDMVYQCDLIFVCLPTPMKPQGGCDVSAIDEFFSFAGYSRESQDRFVKRNYVLRSTVPIGTTKRLAKDHQLTNIVHSPEFLTARCSTTDAHLPARNIVGTVNYEHSVCGGVLAKLYRDRFPGVPVHLMSSDDSEAVKLFTNGFFAVKVAYFNETRALADKLGLDWERVLAAVLGDGRIAHSHTRVPGPDGKRGFGGACLPKDLDNLISCMQEAGTVHYLCEAAEDSNAMMRGERCDAQGAQNQAAGGDAQYPGRVPG